MTSQPVELVSTAGYAALRHVFLQSIMKRGYLPLAELESMLDDLEVRILLPEIFSSCWPP